MDRSKKKLKIVNPREEDRLSRLADDLIHRILSLLDAKDVVQMSLLSTRWKHVWKSLSHLNFNSSSFTRSIIDFSVFIYKFLWRRDHQSDLSVFNLRYNGALEQPDIIRTIATYGASHNLQQLNISCYACELPLSVFTSQSLKQLCLKGRNRMLPKSSWNLPALTTLFLKDFSFVGSSKDDDKSLDLFSNLPNLKNLFLINCHTLILEVFYIISPQLENLKIQLRNSLGQPSLPRSEFVILAPKLSSFKYKSNKPLLLPASDLNCLDKVHIDIDIHNLPGIYKHKQGMCREIINMFHQLSVSKFVTLTLQTVEVLSWVLELLENQPSPFHKMECLKIEGGYCGEDTILSSGALTYLSNSSPTCTIINESSLVFQGP